MPRPLLAPFAFASLACTSLALAGCGGGDQNTVTFPDTGPLGDSSLGARSDGTNDGAIDPTLDTADASTDTRDAAIDAPCDGCSAIPPPAGFSTLAPLSDPSLLLE